MDAHKPPGKPNQLQNVWWYLYRKHTIWTVFLGGGGLLEVGTTLTKAFVGRGDDYYNGTLT